MESKVLSHISNRKSELAFEPKILPQAEIDTLFEAARWAASSYNEQPWRFYYASRDNQQLFEKALGVLAEGNQEWAKNASLLIFSVAKTELTLNGNSNGYAMHDTGMATANLMIQAESLGLASHPMGGFDRDKVKEIAGLTDGYKPVAAIAVGYKGDYNNLSDNNKKRVLAPRKRKDLGEIALKIG
jgi:nitroreductase